MVTDKVGVINACLMRMMIATAGQRLKMLIRTTMRMVQDHNGDLPGPFYTAAGKEMRLDSLKIMTSYSPMTKRVW
ncbi:hypothetical protein NX722_23780 [Endozoicomonas gorgoniicola]|uniref:Uncharacterized protein n=1 Tax=Endozoicomonas gorgoniicola TaxID=1234144 RepID=A0ABT3N1T2_9GAMM|nr:hypothetical protein [Endozoicomonas gorgoniicola]MCW7555588.1 hypothetical protein [Endozoicomonas gorgoniicola]